MIFKLLKMIQDKMWNVVERTNSKRVDRLKMQLDIFTIQTNAWNAIRYFYNSKHWTHSIDNIFFCS